MESFIAAMVHLNKNRETRPFVHMLNLTLIKMKVVI